MYNNSLALEFFYDLPAHKSASKHACDSFYSSQIIKQLVKWDCAS